MMDGYLMLALITNFAMMMGGIGGACGYALALTAQRRIERRIFVAVEAAPITAHVTAPAVVDVPVMLHIPPIAPLTVPIVLAAPPSVAELAERVLAETPELGPDALARIVGCAEDTAYALILDWRDAQGLVAEGAPVREELTG